MSLTALKALKNKSFSRKFWDSFDTKFKEVIAKKRRGFTSLKRVTACTEKMAKQHIDELAEELIRCSITNANRVEDGCWTGDIEYRHHKDLYSITMMRRLSS